jgi:UDP-glucose 4-epimerase
MRGLRRALVLGGAGFIGRSLVERLDEEAVEAIVVDRSLGPEERRHDHRIAADVTDLDLGPLLDKGVDAVFHLANTALVPPSVEAPMEDLRENVLTTLGLLEAVRRAGSSPLVVFVSSAAVYGNARSLPMDEDHPLQPLSPYGISKLACEHYVRLYAELHGISALSVRPFSVYGPGQRKLVVYDILARIRAGEEPLELLGSPDVSRDFVFVEDAARAMTTLARAAPARGEAYNIASGHGTTLRELVVELLQAMGVEREVTFTGRVRPGDPLHWTGDPSRARALGAECGTPLAEGLRRTAQWFLSDAG